MPNIERVYVKEPSHSASCNIEDIAVFTAWPYANGPRHLGHAASLLMGDVLSRYYRAKGSNVLMVSGTDEYGTPNQIAAEKRGIIPQSFVDEVSKIIRNDFKDLGMSFDHFGRTTSKEHSKVAQDFFKELLSKGYITEGKMKNAYDFSTKRSLPDRYVEGICPHCQYSQARGDQCDSCSSLLEPYELISPKSKLTNSEVFFKDTSHLFLRLDKLGEELKDWIMSQSEWRSNARKQALGIVGKLKSTSISRDLNWGIPIPNDVLDGKYGNKVLYVWFEAVTGYLSASIEWAKAKGNPDEWKTWWENPQARHFYAIGKDNIPFHTIVWPGMIMGYNKNSKSSLHLPDQIVSAEYLTYGSEKFSSSRENILYIRDTLRVIDPDVLRYYLISAGPETSDTEFSISELVRRNNEELVATWGNLVNRVLTFSYKHFGCVPFPESILPAKDNQLLEEIWKGFQSTGKLIEQTKFKLALANFMSLARSVNKFLEQKKPWENLKKNKSETATTIFTALNAIDTLASIASPFLPFSSDKILNYLGYDGNIGGKILEEQVEIEGNKLDVLKGNYSSTKSSWGPTRLIPGQKLKEPKILFQILKADQVANLL